MEVTVKNKISEQFDNPECKSSLTLRFRLCLSFLVVCILTPFVYAETLSEDIDPISLLESSLSPGIQDINTLNISEHPKASSGINSNIAANLAARVDKKPSDLLIAKSPVTDLGRQLWQARISVSEDDKSSQSKNELQQIIKQISSVEFKPQDRTLEPLIVVEPAKTAESNEALSNTDMPKKTKPGKPETMPQKSLGSGQQDEKQLLRGQITKQTLQIFEQLSQQPQQIKNPLELAEILFRSNQLKEAAKCYQEALKLMTANENGRHEDKAWILFQIGNCLQKDDPPTATQMYKQLIVECPDSPWVDLAEAKSRLIDWYLKEKPNTLINERKL